MRGLSEYQWGPVSTPAAVRNLIIWTSVITLISAFIQSIFSDFALNFGPQEYLSLSWWGLKNWYLWQVVSFLFIQPLFYHGITFFFLITLLFNMYLLWVIGSDIVDFVGSKSFLKFYFGVGIGAGLLTLALLYFSGHGALIAGPAASILALLMIWTMMHPDLEIFFFFLIPLKAKWIMAAIIGAILLTTISQGDVTSLIYYLSGIFIGYFYGIIAWGLQGPFPFTHKLDHWLSAVSFFKKDQAISSKIIDMRTGKAELSDDKFVDEMLEKIAQRGEKSLTTKERKRLEKISKNKQRQ